jgi:hypothetical protein
MKKHHLTVEAMDLLARIRGESQTPEEQELLDLAINAILFIVSTGQRYAFVDFLEQLDSEEPPAVVAVFDTHGEAEAWLSSHSSPPDSTLVLIGGRYHIILYVRELNHCRIIPHAAMGYHLGQLLRRGLPSTVTAFDTREQAESWLKGQAQPPRQTVIKIAGEYHLAVYHPNVNHRAIHPFSDALGEEQEDDPKGGL